jgi:glycosyltransferase involved in cell wall biosynthesis
VRFAYLCNLYPAVSHSFVRREITAIEQAGHELHRFTLRPPLGDLRDEADLREARITEAILGRGFGRLIVAGLALILTKPTKSLAALSTAFRLSEPGAKSMVRHFVYWLEAAWLTRRLEALGVEHIHAHFGTNPAAICALVRAFGGPPFSFTVHGPDEFDAPIQLGLPVKIANARFVAAISSYGRSQMMRWCPPSQWDKIEVIRCGLDTEFLDAPLVPIPPSSTELLCVARLSGQKGLPLLIAACARLRADGEKFHLTIVGSGELRPTIERDIRARGLCGMVTLAGIRTGAEIRAHLTQARAFVLPSFAEGLPVVIMEALALGRPVITTAIAGIPELVDDQCGWVIPAGSEAALIDAVKAALASSPADLERKGQVGRDRVRQMHDAARNAALVVEAATNSRPTYTQ